jgi:hypothetical protein
MMEAESSDKGAERPENREHIFGGGPPARLYVPADWFDFLSDGADADAAQRRYDSLIERVFPSSPPHVRRHIVNGLLLWREHLWSKGLLSHGIVNVPADRDEPPIFWQVFVIAMRLPPTSPELNTGALLTQLIEQSDLSFATHVETYRTDMGVGLGLFGRQPMRAPGGAANLSHNGDAQFLKNGVAAALSYTPGAEYGLAVVGVSMDPEQDEDIGRLVALIAGRSTFVMAELGDT